MLVVYWVVAYTAAALYLRRRRMSFGAYTLWGLFALLIPAFGPFGVIALRPGKSARAWDAVPVAAGDKSKRIN